MHLEQIKKKINKFVSQNNNDALVIKGNYGVGKTYYWQNSIKEANGLESKAAPLDIENNFAKIGKPSYAYISLFGIDSLETLKTTIISEIVTTINIGKVTETTDKALKKIFTRLEKIPHLEKLTGGLVTSLAFQGIRNTLICLDDIDRKSSKLEITEIIGLANILKEQHDCKIVLILNEEVLKDENNANQHTEYRKQIEKLADFEINFAPLTEEIIELAFPTTFPNQEIIKKFCLRLKINNIRILQKIRRYIEELSEFIRAIENDVLEDILRSLILFVFSHYDKTKNVPTLEEIENFDVTGFNVNRALKKENSEKDSKVYESFKEYDFRGFTDLDKVILDFVKNGFINSQSFTEKLKIRNDAIIAQNGVNKYRQAWRLYNNSFECNDEEFVEKLTEGYLANIDYLEIRNLTETIGILRQLGANENANKLADEYVEKIFDDNTMLLMRRGHSDFKVEDSYLKQKLEEKLNEQKLNRTLKEVLERFSSGNPNYFEDVEFLKSVSEEEFYECFKSYQPKQVENEIQFYIHDLYNQVRACLDFADYSDDRQSIGTNSKRAIIKIALDCEINKVRVMNWFKVSEEEIEQQKNEGS